MFYYNINYLIFMIPAFVLMLAVQMGVKNAYRKWSKIRIQSNLTGLDAARIILQHVGLEHLKINVIRGDMTDFYDPRSNTLNLSQGTAQRASIASVAIAAHEIGHAIQDDQDYMPLRFRSAIVPMVRIGSTLGWVFIFAGLLLSFTDLAIVGLIFFSAGALFSLATLPVEFNASARAKQILQETGIVTTRQEVAGVNSVLNAAALTYVAALVQAVMQVLYYATMIFGGGRRRN